MLNKQHVSKALYFYFSDVSGVKPSYLLRSVPTLFYERRKLKKPVIFDTNAEQANGMVEKWRGASWP